MKRPLLTVAILTLAFAATLAPIRSAPPMLLSDVDGADWKCSRSALILTTCTPNRDVRFTSAGSTGRRNTDVKSLCWGFKLQGLTWPFV